MRIAPFGIAALCLFSAPLAGQESVRRLPFAPGEELVYKAKVGIFGSIGSGVMRVVGPQEFRGVETLLLQFDYRGRFTIFGLENHTKSWFDPYTRSSLRFEKHEKSPISSSREEVDLDPSGLRWTGLEGDSGKMNTDVPLDELSFIFFIRTLELADSAEYSFDRHFNPSRNPVRIKVLRREQVEVPAGKFAAIVVEMRVHDEKHYEKDGVILIHLSDDEKRIPLRVESSVKVAGTLVLSLQANRTAVAAACDSTAAECKRPR